MQLNVNGKISGIYQSSTNTTSDFEIVTDNFKLSTGTSTGISPFRSEGTKVYLNDAVIKNGSIGTAKIGLLSVDYAQLKDGAVDTLKIANGAITTAKITNLAVNTAQIANGAIETAKIGNAQVDTLQVKGNAITVAELFYAEQMMTFNIAKTSSEIAHLYIDAEGGSVSVSFGFDYMRIYNYGDNTGATVVMKIMRGSTKLREVSFSSEGRRGSFTNEYVSLATFLDNPPAGSHRYAVTVETSNTNENTISGQIKARSLLIAGAKDDK